MSTETQDSASSQTEQEASSTPASNLSGRTMVFVGVAVGCLVITGLFDAISRPAAIEEFGKMGQEFYPEFTDPTTATSLTVSVIDPEEVKPLQFSVKQSDDTGQWVIPSHHDYPADAADQLAKTASSIIGIKRGAMISRWESDHAKYGVVDPETDSVSIDQIEGIGKRITIGGPNEATLASYIVGKKNEDSTNQYFVRHPNEAETYIAELDINLTTKFGDWVNTDLLEITNGDIVRLDLNDYSFDEIQGTITGNIESVLTRDSSSADWELEGIDVETEQVKTTAVTETLTALTSLEIAGVRPKQAGLTPDLQIDRAALRSQGDFDRLSRDLLSRGFLLQPNRENQELLELISREGEMFVGASDGLLYRLYFGRAFTGSNEDLEIGLSSDSTEEEGEEAPSDEEAAGDSAEDKEKSGEETPSGKPGRYVFVRVNFDATLLGDVLSKPEEPQEPAEIQELKEKIAAAAEEAATEETAPESETEGSTEEEGTEEETPDEEDTQEQDEEDSSEQEAEAVESDEEKLARMQEEFTAAQAAYQTELAAFEEYQQKIEDGTEKAVELNRRFAKWYYVIPGESYDKLSLDRDNIVEPKQDETSEDPAGGAGLNVPQGLNVPGLNIPGLGGAIPGGVIPGGAGLGGADLGGPDAAAPPETTADQPSSSTPDSETSAPSPQENTSSAEEPEDSGSSTEQESTTNETSEPEGTEE
ncbi:MAG: DUF4340 domain-containing protein [Planctomycetota bacterium]|nr:DUF4340 domain-containing protein [Planctomycetota bacterium]